MREEVYELLKLGPMPMEETALVETVEIYQRLIHQINPPLSNSEAEALLSLFGSDSFYGLAWTVVSLIETAPGWPRSIELPDSDNEWVQLLKRRGAGKG
jgi:hypothetical protein